MRMCKRGNSLKRRLMFPFTMNDTYWYMPSQRDFTAKFSLSWFFQLSQLKNICFWQHSINSIWILLCVASSAYWNLLRVGVDAIASPPDMVCRDLLAGASGCDDATTVLNGPGRAGELHGTNSFLVIAPGQKEAGPLSSEVEECVIRAFLSLSIIANNKMVWVWN